MKPARVFLLAATLLLGACVTEGREGPKTAQTAQPSPPALERAPALEQAAVPVPAPVSAPVSALAPEPQRTFPPPTILDGLEAARVLDLLGLPPFKRQDDPALIWQYRTPSCALDLFLYRDRAGGAYRVRHFETRNRGKADVSTKDCFTALIIAKENGSSG